MRTVVRHFGGIAFSCGWMVSTAASCAQEGSPRGFAAVRELPGNHQFNGRKKSRI